MARQKNCYTIYLIKYPSHFDLFVGLYSFQVVRYRLCSLPEFAFWQFSVT